MTSNNKGESDINPTESETTCMVGSNPRGIWEIPETSLWLEMDRSVKARCHNADMYVSGKSDSLVVPEKRANIAGVVTVVPARRDGGKETDQGERLAVALGPDSEPGCQVAWAAGRTGDSTASRSEVGRHHPR